MTHKNGSPYECGVVDHFEGRARRPRKWSMAAGIQTKLTPAEIAEYDAGRQYAEETGFYRG